MDTEQSYLNNKHVMAVMKKMAFISRKYAKNNNKRFQFSLASSKCFVDKNGILHIDQKYNRERDLINDKLDDLRYKVAYSNYQFSKEQLTDYLRFSAAQVGIDAPNAEVTIENYNEQIMSTNNWPIILSLVENGNTLHQLRITPFTAAHSTNGSRFIRDSKILPKIVGYCFGRYGEKYREDYCIAAIVRAKKSIIYGYSSLSSASSTLTHDLAIINMSTPDFKRLITMPIDEFNYDYHVYDRTAAIMNKVNISILEGDYSHMQAVKRKVDKSATHDIHTPLKHYYYNEDGILCIEDKILNPNAKRYMLKEAGESEIEPEDDDEEENSK